MTIAPRRQPYKLEAKIFRRRHRFFSTRGGVAHSAAERYIRAARAMYLQEPSANVHTRHLSRQANVCALENNFSKCCTHKCARSTQSLLSKFVFIYCVPRRSSSGSGNLFSAAILCVLVENLQIIQRAAGKPDKVKFIRSMDASKSIKNI
jgi:hypothetical protein